MSRTMTARRGGRMLLAAVVIAASLVAWMSVQPVGAVPAAAPVAPEFLCAAPWSGAFYYLPNGCPKGFEEVDMTGGPVDACASGYTGQFFVAPAGVCPGGQALVQIGAGSGTLGCANMYTGAAGWWQNLAQPCPWQPIDWGASSS